MLFAIAGLAPGAAQAGSETRTFNTTGGPYNFVVPRGVTSVQVHAIGGVGGPDSASGAAAGQAAEVQTTLAVTPGQAFYVYVAGNGTAYDGYHASVGGFNGGGGGGNGNGSGGGGASDIRTNSGDLSSRLVVAAGSGGGGSFAAGGAAGSVGTSAVGGSLAQPGTANAGGAGGSTPSGSTPGTDGTFGAGGNGGVGIGRFGGGGGGGWYGGGGGAGYQGGAGGSNYITPNGSSGTTEGLNSNPPVVEFTYTTPPPATSIQLSVQPGTTNVGATTTVTATVQEQSGAAAFGDVLTFASDKGGDSFSAVVDHGDGTYTATLTAATPPGQHTITVTDTSVTPAISRQITVTVLEAPSLVVTTASDTSTDSDGATSLREALAYAAQLGDGKTITFAPFLTGATITLNGSELQITKDVTIAAPAGPGYTRFVTIDAAGASRVLHVLSGKTATVIGVLIKSGKVDDAAPGAGWGGGVLNEGSLTLSDCFINSNTAGGTNIGNGGAIYHHGTSLTLTRCSFRLNSAKTAGFGGAIYADAGTVTMNGSSFTSNSAEGDGGAVANAGATLTATNCTFGQNSALNGGAVVQNEGSASLVFCTVSQNTAQVTGGGLERVGRIGATFTLESTLVAGNTAQSVDYGADLCSYAAGDEGAFISNGHNLIGIGLGSTGLMPGANGDQVGTSSTPIDARLDRLSVWGGITYTYPLLFDSPAIDAGGSTMLPTDQRGNGFDRVIKGSAASAQAAADIGAFELLAPPTVATASLTYASNDPTVNLTTATGAAPAGGTFEGAGVSSPIFDPAAAGVGVHTLIYKIKDAGLATNQVSITVEVQRYRGGAVDDVATNGASGTTLRPMANDKDGVANGVITGVGDSAIQIGADGRSLIVPAGYAGTFFYTVDGVYTADVTIAAATGGATAARWEGLITDANGQTIGAAAVTKSAKGSYTAMLRSGLRSATTHFKLPTPDPVTVKTKIGNVVFAQQTSGALTVQLSNGETGLLRPALKAATAARYNLALSALDAAVPGGGFLTLTVKTTGAAKLVGTLPDGRTFSASGYEREDQSFAFYGLIPGSPKGIASGILTLANMTASDVTGEFKYTLPAQKKGLNKGGVDTTVLANGCQFIKDTPAFPDGQLGFMATGGDLAAPISAVATFTGGVPALSDPLSVWTYNKTTGAFSVKLRTAPAPAPLQKVKGVCLPKTTSAWGFFSGATEGGSLRIAQP